MGPVKVKGLGLARFPRAALGYSGRWTIKGFPLVMDVIVSPLIALVSTVFELYIWVLIVGVVASWLVNFRVLNTSNRVVYLILDFTHRATEPALRPIRRILPDLGGIDVSPIVLILLLYFAKDILVRLLIKLA